MSKALYWPHGEYVLDENHIIGVTVVAEELPKEIDV